MSKTVAEWQLRATADGWKWNDIEYFWYNDKGERSLYHELEGIYTTHSPDVAGSDAVAFAEWIGANYVTNGPGIWSRERDMQRAVTPKYSSSQLYAKFREEHPHPAGASVEQAAHDYVKGMLGDYDPELQEEYDAILAHVLKGVELSGAAFQAAQGVESKLFTPEDDLFPPFKNEEISPAPAAVSAGTWRKASDVPVVIDKKVKPVLVRYIKHKDKVFHTVAYYFPDRFKIVEWEDWDDYDEADYPYTENDVDAGCVWLRAGWYESVECDKCEGYWSAPLKVTEWMPIPTLDESAPGIPDVRELVNGLLSLLDGGPDSDFAPLAVVRLRNFKTEHNL